MPSETSADQCLCVGRGEKVVGRKGLQEEKRERQECVSYAKKEEDQIQRNALQNYKK